MSEQTENTVVIPAMDETSISIDCDGSLRIEQMSQDGDMSIVDVPALFIPFFLETLNTAIARAKDRHE